jgi:hypothetical protein
VSLAAASASLLLVASATVTPGDRATTYGSIEVDAPPHVVYRVATNYAAWSELFSDVSEVRVLGPNEVEFTSRIMKGTVTVQFHNEPGRTIHYDLVHPSDWVAQGTIELIPLDGGRRTLVRTTQRVEVHNVIGRILVGPATVRARREAKVRADLEDLARRFQGGSVRAR